MIVLPSLKTSSTYLCVNYFVATAIAAVTTTEHKNAKPIEMTASSETAVHKEGELSNLYK